MTKTAQELEQKKVLIARKDIKPSKNNPVLFSLANSMYFRNGQDAL
ncbi:hypothetical protein [sulfur-oxidizing endosymbiont of Gigantopelta aegis]|nr:hypothetical protein [sulfur-oxidizing endosymbiont of Gigantopelta aegis]